MTTRQTTTINVPFNLDNIKLCRCPICPVQHDSQCTKDKLNRLQETVSSNPIDPKKVPAEYCAQGKATCTDLDSSQTCICDTCEVYAEYNLGDANPDGYYCTEGKALSKKQ
jgi:hypothetical protein